MKRGEIRSKAIRRFRVQTTNSPHDHPVAEGFFSTLKSELVFHEEDANHTEGSGSLFDEIELFDNCLRLHSTLGYRGPAQYELRIAS